MFTTSANLGSPAGILPRDASLKCETARAPDYYGLGVRMGIYFAWFQAYIANTTLASEIPGALDTNTVFLLTILVAMLKCTITDMLHQIDGLILMHLSGGTIFGILSLWGYRTRQYVENGPSGIRFFGGFGTHARLIVSLSVSCYGLWFWMFGVTGSLAAMGADDEVPNDPACSTLYTFMFAKVRADGGVRIFYLFVCISCIVYFGVMILASTIVAWARISKMVELARGQRWAESSRLRYATGFNYGENRAIFKVLRVLNLLWLIFSILLVEFTLNFNHVTDVLGGPEGNELHLPAQLLPLLIGAFGFVRTSYLAFENWRNPVKQIEPSLSAPDTPRASRTMHPGIHMLQAFSPAMARESVTTEHDPKEIDELERRRSLPVRYLVAWLPWLGLLKRFHDEPRLDAEKTRSEDSQRSIRGAQTTSYQ